MTHVPIDLDLDPDQLRLDGLLHALSRESEQLRALLPSAVEAQWEAAPVPRAADDTTERSKGGYTDPTSRIVLDERRTHLRECVLRSEACLREQLVRVRAVRLALGRALSSWEGA